MAWVDFKPNPPEFIWPQLADELPHHRSFETEWPEMIVLYYTGLSQRIGVYANQPKCPKTGRVYAELLHIDPA